MKEYMAFVTTQPENQAFAAENLQSIGSAVITGYTAAAPTTKGLSNLRSPFGVVDRNRIHVKREQVRGHLLDRQNLELIRAG